MFASTKLESCSKLSKKAFRKPLKDDLAGQKINIRMVLERFEVV